MMKNAFSALEEPGRGFNPVPSLFTLCNGICGFTSILYTMSADAGQIPLISLLLIGAAMVFDVLDGLAARLLKAQSVHGMNLDSMADVVSFGVAPAIMIYHIGLGDAPLFGAAHGISWLVAAFYLGCVLWRLAVYNTQASQEEQEEEESDNGDFIGLPSPGAAALICSMVVLIPAMGLGERVSFSIYMAYAAISAFLMVSTLPYLHIRRGLTITNKWGRIGVVALLLSSILVFKAWALVLWTHLYLLYAPLWALESRLVQHMHKVRAAGVSPDDEP